MVVLGHGPLALVHLDGDGGLVVGVGGEGLGLLGGDSGVPLDEAGHDTTSSLDTKGQRSNIKQEQVGHSLAGTSGQDSSDIGGGGALILIIRNDLNLRTNKDFYKYCSGFYNKRLSEANYYVVVCSRVWRPGTVLRGRPGTMTCSTLGTADKETLC